MFKTYFFFLRNLTNYRFISSTLIMNPEKNICLIRLMKPILSIAKIFGIHILDNCNCEPEVPLSKFRRFIYQTFLTILEIYWWSYLANLIFYIFSDGIACKAQFKIFSKYSILYIVLYILAILVAASMHSTFLRRKISFPCEGGYYIQEYKRLEEIESFSFSTLLFVFSSLLGIRIVTEFGIFSKIKEECSCILEAVFCTVLLNLTVSFIIIEAALITLQSFLVFWIMYKKLDQLSKDFNKIERNPSFLKFRLDELIYKHTEILYLIEDINDFSEYIAPIVYSYCIYQTCFCICIVLFMEMTIQMKILFIVLFCFLCSAFFIIGHLLSRFTAQIYGEFKNMQIFSSSNLGLKEKLKILDFMKRFSKTPIGISVGGFFHVKKNIVIRMIAGMESVLSALISLAQEKKVNSCSDVKMSWKDTDLHTFNISSSF